METLVPASENEICLLNQEVSLIDQVSIVADYERLPSSNDSSSKLIPPPSSSSSVNVNPASSSATGNEQVKKALYKVGQRTSNFRGVTRHRWTGKFEAHLWDNTTISETRKRKGKQGMFFVLL
ncbi:hypothetical protein C5167_033726 [Papaver somniferum]|uniref:AP2/ERF domain-containing protein n=1 Tax=Papaver somniferum TaxID=3469 RepID=A0A4Y7KD12_PAPSO|nr:hypothetical protein C5167_033726 [Papaver somniferum]